MSLIGKPRLVGYGRHAAVQLTAVADLSRMMYHVNTDSVTR